MSKIKYIAAVLFMIIAGFLFYTKIYIPKSTYTKVSPKKGDMNIKVFGIGTLGAKNIYAINALTAGKILKITKDEGTWVKKGEVLVEMDPVDLPQLIDEAKIGVQKAFLEVDASKKELQSLIAQKRLAQLTYKRYEKLKEQSFASQSEYDKAKADLDAIDAQIAATKARISSAKAEVMRMKKSVESLEIKLAHYTIKAPVDGYIIVREADVSESVVSTQPILKVVDPKTVWIRAYIDERLSGKIKVAQHAFITLRSQPNKKFAGVVTRIVAQSDAITQEREVDISFEKLPLPFYMNEQAEVNIITKKLKNILQIPADVLIHKDAKNGVWLDIDAKAHFVTLKIVAISNGTAAVTGLSLTDKIIVPKADKKPLFEGAGIH